MYPKVHPKTLLCIKKKLSTLKHLDFFIILLPKEVSGNVIFYLAFTFISERALLNDLFFPTSRNNLFTNNSRLLTFC